MYSILNDEKGKSESSIMTSFNKFWLLMWKNYKLQVRKPLQFLFEIGIPILVISLFYISRYNIENYEKVEDFAPGNIADQNYMDYGLTAYAPNTISKLNSLMKAAFPYAKGYETITEMEKSLTNHPQESRVGLHFLGNWPDNAAPQNLTFVLRYQSNYVVYNEDKLWPGYSIGYGRSSREPPNYYEMGFLHYQMVIANQIFKQMNIPTTKFAIERFPYVTFDPILNILDEFSLLPWLFTAAFVYASISIVKAVTHEKEMQLKESMKVMGLPTWLHWTAWFCQMFITFFIVAVVSTIIMKWETRYGKIFENTDSTVILTLFVLYVSSLITFCFAISTFFSKANKAASFIGIVWVMSIMPYILIRPNNINVSPFTKYISSICIPSAISFGLDVIVGFEAAHKGSHWGNLFQTLDNNISLGGIFLVMIFDIFFYLLIAVYVEAVLPGDFGVPMKFYFPFTKSFWFPNQHKPTTCLGNNNVGEYFEEEPTNLKIGIQIKHLGKTFGTNDAVKSLNLNMYEGQITVLLGHNGAGKTTTMSMLTGMFPSSRGTAIVNGYDINTDIMKVRDSMGLCLQHNVLFDDLTVREHLIFFSKLKGVQGEEVDREVKKFLNLLALEDKADTKSSALSGGMKRKLSAGIALCGKSKVIMLDEPTAGMDPSARRFVWEFLQKHKEGRTILLTTHFMDEADLLGDRIAIMSGGELQCCGSSFFLKKKYGTGYHLVIDKTSKCNPNNITNVLRRYIPDVEVESDAGTELTYLLPEAYADKFATMLSNLENSSDSLGIRSYGISLTDMEEVFMKVGSSKHKNGENSRNGENGYSNVAMGRSRFETGSNLWFNQAHAVILKKFLTIKRSWITELLKIIFPIASMLLIFYAKNNSFKEEKHVSRSYQLSDYTDPITLIEKSSSQEHKYFTDLMDSMKQKYEITDNITDTMIKATTNDVEKAKYHYIVGASFKKQFMGWFSNEPYHAAPLIVQLLLNSHYHHYLKEQKAWINFELKPLPKVLSGEEVDILNQIFGGLNILAFSLAVAYIANFYILFNVKERICKAKHLQLVSGIKIAIFWGVSFLVDFCTYLIDCVILLIVVIIIKPAGLDTARDLIKLSFYLFTVGLAVLPWIYVFSYLFTVPSTAYSRSFMISFLVGFPAALTVMALETIQWKWLDLTKTILRLFPLYDFSQCINPFNAFMCQMNKTEKIQELGRSFISKECDKIFNFDKFGTGMEVISMFLIFVVCITILILTDYKILTNLTFWLLEDKRPPIGTQNVDDDVQKENDHVKNRPQTELQSNFVLILKDLTKRYGWFGKKFTAVNGLNLTVSRSECFGLLGVNGAGKTTTFKMMTGDEYISYGNGWVNGYSIKTQMDDVQRFIGYCPQFDALLVDLTARETLKMFCLIRGVPRIDCALTAENLAKDFDFYEHLDKQVKALSGGNKRKLSAAISLIGDAPIIFLDEPSTGMDPSTKRHLWNTLAKIRDSGKSIVLTSHSMEECEALCTRLVIMVNGNFQCLGSTQHLKNKFAEGYSITLKVKKLENSSGLDHADTSEIENFMQHKFPNAVLREKHQELLSYFIKDPSLTWSRLFAILQDAKGRHSIEDYSVGQASLEQVFLNFTKNQLNAEDNEASSESKCCKLWCC